MNNSVIIGDCEDVLKTLPPASADLVFCSPPYYNAREYVNYPTYENYLAKMKSVFFQCSKVLKEGAFCVVNSSPVLVARENRRKSSSRLAIPFDLHNQLTPYFDFIDDIFWVKPDGAGWVSGRGRRFSVDRSPTQYKSVPVTEYVMVYRNKTNKLIDWGIKQRSKEAQEESKITGTYDVTNLWKIHPSHDKRHPAIFPLDLAERVIKYYSFVGDTVIDPFGGIGTTGKAALKLKRNFILIEKEQKYVDAMREDFTSAFDSDSVEFIIPPINSNTLNN